MEASTVAALDSETPGETYSTPIGQVRHARLQGSAKDILSLLLRPDESADTIAVIDAGMAASLTKARKTPGQRNAWQGEPPYRSLGTAGNLFSFRGEPLLRDKDGSWFPTVKRLGEGTLLRVEYRIQSTYALDRGATVKLVMIKLVVHEWVPYSPPAETGSPQSWHEVGY